MSLHSIFISLEYTDINIRNEDDKNILSEILASHPSGSEIFVHKIIIEHVANLLTREISVDQTLLNVISSKISFFNSAM